MSFSIDWIENDPVVSFTEFTDYKEIDHANTLLLSDLRFDQMNYQIFDFSGVRQFRVSKLNAEMLVINDKYASAWNKHVKLALIVSNDEMLELAGFYVKIMAESFWKVRIFNNITLARQWVTSSE